jgi:hypothetical protein
VYVLVVPFMWWECYIVLMFVNVAVISERRCKQAMHGVECLITQSHGSSNKPEHKYFINLACRDNAVVFLEIRRVLMNFGREFRTRLDAFLGMVLLMLCCLMAWLANLLFRQMTDDLSALGEQAKQKILRDTTHLGILCSVLTVSMFSALSVIILIGDQTNNSVQAVIEKIHHIEMARCRLMGTSNSESLRSAEQEGRTVQVLSALVRSLECQDRMVYIKIFGARSSTKILTGFLAAMATSAALGAQLLYCTARPDVAFCSQ